MSNSTLDLFIGNVEILSVARNFNRCHSFSFCSLCFYVRRARSIRFHCIIFIDLAWLLDCVLAPVFCVWAGSDGTCLDIDSIKINFALICRRWSFGCDGIYCRCASMSKCYLHFQTTFSSYLFVLFFCFCFFLSLPALLHFAQCQLVFSICAHI